MKIIFSLVLLFSVSAMASNVCSMTWEQINQSQYNADFPKIQFGTVFMGVDGVCVKGQKVYTQEPVEVCAHWSTGESSDCLHYVKKTLSTPIKYQKEIPQGDSGFTTITETIPMTYSVPVGKFWGEAGLHAVCNKTYRIPNCR